MQPALEVSEVAPRVAQDRLPSTPYNGPGRVERFGRASGIMRDYPIRPRKLGHAVVGTTDLHATVAFFTEGLGFVVSDYIGGKGTFMRCSTDHHNVLALAAPVNFLHRTSWQVNDVDDIGRGAAKMLEGKPERHVRGLGGTTPARTSSGTSRTRPATPPSTTPTWTASPRTKSGSRRCSKAPGPVQLGAASPAVLPGSRRPRRAHDRPALRRLRTMVISAKIVPARASARPEQVCGLRPGNHARIV